MNYELRITNYKKILFFCFFAFLLFYQINITIAATCSEGGGVCSPPSSCGSGNYQDNNATGCSGGETCCKQSIYQTSNTGGETVKILGKTVNTDSLDGFMQVAIAVADFIFGITGSLALLMFVYGGFMFLISSGSTETVNKAKQIIIGAVAGIVIIFTSYMIVGFVFSATGVLKKGDTSSWSKINWFKDK
jgi:hypothetical protein